MFVVPGEPKGKGRPRFSRASGRAYTPKDTAVYENWIKVCFLEKYPGFKPLETPVGVSIVACYAIPKSFSKKKREAALIGSICPTKKPDIDNIVKCMDALNGVAWKDDKQIVTEKVTKKYGEDPKMIVTIYDISEKEEGA